MTEGVGCTLKTETVAGKRLPRALDMGRGGAALITPTMGVLVMIVECHPEPITIQGATRKRVLTAGHKPSGVTVRTARIDTPHG
jgi:hypothetical protein